MGKKRDDPPAQPEGLRQVNIRLSPKLYRRVEATAEVLSLDLAQFLRMLVAKHLSQYEREAEEILRAQGNSQKPDQKEPS